LSERPQLWILVGGNGAGKSTYYRLALEPLGLPFVNADVLARIVFAEAPEAHSYEAAQLAERQRHQLLERGVSFCFETVYSHSSKIDFIARAKSLGYQVIMVLTHLESTGLNQARIAGRVSEGGHSVPAFPVCWIRCGPRSPWWMCCGSTTTPRRLIRLLPCSRSPTAA